MRNKIFIISAIFLSFGIQSCDSADSRNLDSEIAVQTQTPQTQNILEKKVEFNGISFTYNSQIFGEVKAEEIADYFLEYETDKPDYVAPQHSLFTFDLSTGYSPMQIAVYPIDDFPRMYAVNKSSMNAMQESINDFKKVLKDKNFRVNNQIPFLPFRDAGQSFQVKVKHFPFSGGKGILFLTFWNTEIELPSNRQLRYIFEGLTNDGKYYVLAEMPIKVSFLSNESTDEYEDYKIDWKKLNDKTEIKRRTKFMQKIVERLEKLSPNEFEPNLYQLEKIISTLKIEK